MSQNELLDILHRGLLEMGQSLDRQTEVQLIRYVSLIAQWNHVYKLTNIHDTDTMITRHLLDSLSILPYIDGNTILDVGTGAGLPGIPLAVAMPNRQFLLLDSNQKKTKFLQQTCYQMRLHNVRVVCHRIEEYQADSLFDVVISRNFSTLPEFLNVSRHLVRKSGQVLAMKGVYPLTELQDIPKSFKLIDVYPLKVPKLDADRHVIDLSYEPEVNRESRDLYSTKGEVNCEING